MLNNNIEFEKYQQKHLYTSKLTIVNIGDYYGAKNRTSSKNN